MSDKEWWTPQKKKEKKNQKPKTKRKKIRERQRRGLLYLLLNARDHIINNITKLYYNLNINY